MSARVLRRPTFWFVGLWLAATLGRGAIFELVRLDDEKAALRDEVYRQLGANDALRQQILGLGRSDRTLERLARRELGLVAEGEIVYRFSNRQALDP